MNFRAVLAPPKTAGSAKTHRTMSSIWIVWSTLYVYLCPVSGKCLSGEPHIYLALKICKSLKFAIQFLNFFDPIVLIVADVTIFWANMPYAYELMDFDRAGAAILPTAFLEVAQTLPKF